MKVLPGLASVLLAALVGGCGASSVNSPAFEAQGLGTQEPTALTTTVEGRMVPASGKTDRSTRKYRKSARKVAKKLAAVAKPGSASYMIGPQDVLDISVFKVAELSKTVRVSDIGTVNMPLVGEIRAGGRTARDVERELTRKWGAKYLQNPQVTVFVKEYNSQRVTIEGAVKKPGVFPIRGKMTLLQAIATVGGFSAASDSTVLVFRETNGKRKAAKFDVASIRSGAAHDPRLQAGDVVIAGKSAIKAGLNNILKVLPLAGVFTLL